MTHLMSMTGFGQSELLTASGDGVAWELRSVHGRSPHLSGTLPGGMEQFEAGLRDHASTKLKRGNVRYSLTLRRVAASDTQVQPALLDQILDRALALAARILGAPVPRAEALLALPGVILRNVSAEGATNCGEVGVDVRAGFVLALDRLIAARAAEGARLGEQLRTMLGELGAACAEATRVAAVQPGAHRARLVQSLAVLLQDGAALPDMRIAQEVALLATRSDVREGLDRLASRLSAVSSPLYRRGPVGREMDFLVQELARETSTICSKSISLGFTHQGLRLKTVIEQLREQVQNLG